MKIDLDWIQKELDAGREVELECVDIDGLLDANKSAISEWKSEVVKGIVRVAQVEELTGIIELISSGGLGLILFCHDLKYFRIKEKTKNTTDITSHTHKGVTSGTETEHHPTFDELIDVAVQAVKDGAIHMATIRTNEISFMHENAHYKLMPAFDCKDQVDLIKSLYTETFVIESVEDINKVISRKEIGFNKKHMTVATLMNGNEILITKLDSDNTNGVVVYMRDGLYKNYLGIDVLKGATVTQKRGK